MCIYYLWVSFVINFVFFAENKSYETRKKGINREASKKENQSSVDGKFQISINYNAQVSALLCVSVNRWVSCLSECLVTRCVRLFVKCYFHLAY